MLQTLWSGLRHLRLMFVGVAVLLLSLFGFAAWWLIDQDQRLIRQRVNERQAAAADLVVATLKARIADVDQDLERILNSDSRAISPTDSGAVYVQLQRDSVRSWPEHGLLYSPIQAETQEPAETLFAAADELEFHRQDYAAAASALRPLTLSTDLSVRAAALARLARNYRKNGRMEESLKAGGQISDFGSVTVAGIPAKLAGALSTAYTLDQQNNDGALSTAVRDLDAELHSGKYHLSSAVYRSLAAELEKWLPPDKQPVRRPLAVTEAIESLWRQWNDGELPTASRRLVSTASGARPLLLAWKGSPDKIAGFAADSDYVNSDWLSEIRPRLENLRVDLALVDSEGRAVLGNSPAAGKDPAIKLASDTALPWTTQVFSTSDDAAEIATRRRLLLAVMGGLLALLLTGTWFVGHAVSRDLALARLKTDFVSSVSHEFRTPLTTLCQLSEMLKRGRVATEREREQYYELLHSESNRLRRLVEALLNFGRLEAGKFEFQFEPLDAADFVQQSASAFVESQQSNGHRLEIAARESSMIRADRETLQCALWNLFENAVKYSPKADTVWIDVSREGKLVEISVRDRGSGIPQHEQERVFEKFVRGTAAREGNVRGSGIGLAMAREIVRAHGGNITVKSEYGKGSAFLVVLPSVEDNS